MPASWNVQVNRPSSTITAASIAGIGMTLFWAVLTEFTQIKASADLVALSVTFVTSIAGYLKKENVL